MGACCIATRGMICSKHIYAVVCDHPEVVTATELSPSIVVTTPPEGGEPTSPMITRSSLLRPQIRSTRGPTQVVTEPEPTVVDSDELRPQIRKAQEE